MKHTLVLGVSGPLIWYPPGDEPQTVNVDGGVSLRPGRYEGATPAFDVPDGMVALVSLSEVAARVGRWELYDAVIPGPYRGPVAFVLYPKVFYLGEEARLFVVKLVEE